MLGQLDWDGVVLPINDVTWTNVLATAERLQGLDIAEGFFVTYKDDEGDVINVKNETDLTEAVRWAGEQGVPCLCLHVPFSSAESDSDESWTEIDNGSPRTGKVEAPVPDLPELDDSEKRPMEEEEDRATPDRHSEADEAEQETPAEAEEEFHDTPVVQSCHLTPPEIEAVVEVKTVTNEPVPVEPVVEEEEVKQQVVTVTPIIEVFAQEEEVKNIVALTPIPEVFAEEQVTSQAIGIDRLIEVMCSANDAGAVNGAGDKEFFLNLLAVPANIDKLVAFLGHPSVRQAVATIAQTERASAGSAQKASTTQLIKMLYQTPEVLVLLNAIPELEQVLLRILRALKLVETKEAEAVKHSTEPKTLHAHVTCDGCGSDDELLAASVAASCRNEQGEIMGVRYKSVALPDFDLCETCEATSRFQKKAGPFLKIVDPGTAPDVISYTYEPVRRTSNVAPAAAEEPEEEEAPPAVVLTKAEWRCKHWLKAFNTPHGSFTCDVCSQPQAIHTLLHGCRTCNFDVCHPCFVSNQGVDGASVVQNTEVPKVAPSPPQLPAVVVPSAPQAKFVSDVTLTDGCAVRPGERLSKTWRVRNSGSERWLAGTRICHVGGDAFGGPLEGVEVPLAAPGEAVNITVPLVMPYQPGRYTSYWRLMTPHPQNAKFGHRFWVTVNVLPAATPLMPPPPPPLPSAPVFRPAPPPPPTQLVGSPVVMPRPSAPPMPAVRKEPTEIRPEYVSAVEQIVGFGFADIDKIAEIVNEVKGDVAAAVERLLEEA